MSITISGEVASTARDALIFYIYQAEMECGRYAGTPEVFEAEMRLVCLSDVQRLDMP